MIGHNTSAALVSAASEINQEHKGMIAAIEDSEARARRIGQVLIDLKPVLKEAGVNLTDFCKEHLPFGKTAAYDFIRIAEGKVTLQELNARKYSAPAEKPTATELPKIFGYMNFHQGLAMLRAMFWVDHGTEWETEFNKLGNLCPSETIESTGLPITKSDFQMACMALAKMKEEGVLDDKLMPDVRSIVLGAIEHAVEKTDLYWQGYPLVLKVVGADKTRAELVRSGDIKAAQALAEKQQVHADVLGMSVDTVRMLHGLMMNHDANMVCLSEGGGMRDHPLRDAYMALFPYPFLDIRPDSKTPSGCAEDWCMEATAMTALGYAKDHEEASNEIQKSFQDRFGFWSVSFRASESLNRHFDEFTSKPKLN